MKTNQSACRWLGLVAALGAVAFVLNGCSGSDGSAGTPGAPGATVGVTSPTDATSLSMAITSATVSSPPVVNFTVTDQRGVPVVGFTNTDLRFNIAKLTPGTNGNPGTWQNYMIRASRNDDAIQGSQERLASGYPFGTFVDHKNGSYTYTFATDITKFTSSSCPLQNAGTIACTDADGNPLDLSYQPTLTHRIGIQLANSTYPKANATYDFVPAGGTVTYQRDIVQTSNCNECHNQLAVHGGTRVETKLCVTCHNPGSWVAGTPNTTVDFKVMIHKIHHGDELPSVVAGTPYKIGNADFSDVAFPQDIRNCTKCHTNTDTVTARNTQQGDNWETRPSIAACGSCHDNIDFSKDGSGTPPIDPNGHPGGIVTDNSECLTCHSANRIAGSIAESHSFPAKLAAEGAKYKLGIVSVTNGTPSSKPTITFKITDANNVAYDIANTPAITGGSMSLLIGWKSPEPSASSIMPIDFNNSDASKSPNPVSISLLSGGALASSVTDNGNRTYSVTSTTAIPATATGSGRVGFYARMSVDVDGDGAKDEVEVKSVVFDFPITGSKAVARRTVVDIAKCDKCHERLSLHGSSRTDEPQLCVMCHNPDNTDISKRPALVTDTLDGQKEESIDFKRMIHGIHAGATTRYDGTAAEGFRTKGLVVWGYPGAGVSQGGIDCTSPKYACQNDFSDTRFPGILKDCTTCHVGTSYQLTGVWEDPTRSGILASTTDHGASLTDPSDDLNTSPTAAACTSCHDDIHNDQKLQHLPLWGLAQYLATQESINNSPEICVTCHGPGGPQDVKLMHGVK